MGLTRKLWPGILFVFVFFIWLFVFEGHVSLYKRTIKITSLKLSSLKDCFWCRQGNRSNFVYHFALKPWQKHMHRRYWDSLPDVSCALRLAPTQEMYMFLALNTCFCHIIDTFWPTRSFPLLSKWTTYLTKKNVP